MSSLLLFLGATAFAALLLCKRGDVCLGYQPVAAILDRWQFTADTEAANVSDIKAELLGNLCCGQHDLYRLDAKEGFPPAALGIVFFAKRHHRGLSIDAPIS